MENLHVECNEFLYGTNASILFKAEYINIKHVSLLNLHSYAEENTEQINGYGIFCS